MKISWIDGPHPVEFSAEFQVTACSGIRCVVTTLHKGMVTRVESGTLARMAPALTRAGGRYRLAMDADALEKIVEAVLKPDEPWHLHERILKSEWGEQNHVFDGILKAIGGANAT